MVGVKGVTAFADQCMKFTLGDGPTAYGQWTKPQVIAQGQCAWKDQVPLAPLWSALHIFTLLWKVINDDIALFGRVNRVVEYCMENLVLQKDHYLNMDQRNTDTGNC